MRRIRPLFLAGLLGLPLVVLAAPTSDPVAPAKPAAGAVHDLSEFGPATPANAAATYAKAIETMRKTGGVLLVPANVAKQIKDLPLQGLTRTPPAPAETKQWKNDNGVTVVVVDEQKTTVQVPPLTGLHLDRHLRLQQGDSLPHWGTHPMLTLEKIGRAHV